MIDSEPAIFAKTTQWHGVPPITQIAYLVPDLDKAVTFWARHLKVGPFKIIRHIPYAVCEYHGNPLELDLSIALAWRDGLQVELMQQHSSAASVFSDHVPTGDGFHHVGIRTEDIKGDEQRLISAGMKRLQRGVSTTGTETTFMGGVPGAGIVELIYVPDGGVLSETLKQAARDWDGIDPVLL